MCRPEWTQPDQCQLGTFDSIQKPKGIGCRHESIVFLGSSLFPRA